MVTMGTITSCAGDPRLLGTQAFWLGVFGAFQLGQGDRVWAHFHLETLAVRLCLRFDSSIWDFISHGTSKLNPVGVQKWPSTFGCGGFPCDQCSRWVMIGWSCCFFCRPQHVSMLFCAVEAGRALQVLLPLGLQEASRWSKIGMKPCNLWLIGKGW